MNPDFDTILDDCLLRMRSGETLEDCLRRYPAQAEALRPLLEAAGAARRIHKPRMSAAQAQAARRRTLMAARQQFSGQPVSKSGISRYMAQIMHFVTGKEIPNMKLSTRLAVLILALAVVLTTGGIASVSAHALPGDVLYPIKRTIENTRLLLTQDPVQRERIEAQLRAERAAEVRSVLQEGRTAPVEFWGTLEQTDQQTWQVGGFTVQVDANTQMAGAVQAGMLLHIQARAQGDGSLVAVSIAPAGTPVPGVTATASPYPGPQETNTPMPTQGGATAQPSMTPMPTHEPGMTPSMTPMSTQGGGMTPMPTQGMTPMPTHTGMPGGGGGMTPMPTQGGGMTPMPTQGGGMTPMPTQGGGMTPMPTQGGGMTPMPTQGGGMTPMPTQGGGMTPMPTQGGGMTPMPTQGGGMTPMPTQGGEMTPMPTSTGMPGGGGGMPGATSTPHHGP